MNEKSAVAKSNVQNVAAFLQEKKDTFAAVLPKHMTPERLVKVACAAVSRSPKLAKCSIPSLYMAMIQASQLGLEPGLDAHLVPYYNSKIRSHEAIMIPDYRGLIAIARRSGEITKFEARIVFENDTFDYCYGDAPKITHKPTLRSKGAMIATYAVAYYKDGSTQFEVMNSEEIEKIKRSSKAAGGGPWVQWPEAMWKKTVVKQLCKFLPRSIELAQAIAVEDAAESGQPPHVGIKGEELFDVEFDEVEDDGDAAESEKAANLKDTLAKKKADAKAAKKAEAKPKALPAEKKAPVENRPAPSDGHNHFALATGDVEAHVEALEKAGWKIDIQNETEEVRALIGPIESLSKIRLTVAAAKRMGLDIEERSEPINRAPAPKGRTAEKDEAYLKERAEAQAKAAAEAADEEAGE
jgi:recombination protein RecT